MAKTRNTKPRFADKIFEKYSFDSLEEMIKLYVNPDTTDKLAVDLLKEIAQYQYQKQPRAQADPDALNQKNPEELAALRARLKAGLNP